MFDYSQLSSLSESDLINLVAHDVSLDVILDSGYREKNVNAPMVYSKAVEESTDILAGIKANYKINDTFTFNYALGLEYSLNDNMTGLNYSKVLASLDSYRKQI